MTDPRESPASGDLTVVDGWRLLVKPVPGRQAAGYVGVLATIALLNLSAISAIVAVSVPDPGVASAAGLIHTAVIPGALLALAIVPTSDVDPVEWLVIAFGLGLVVLILGGLVLALLPVRVGPIAVVGWTALLSLLLSALAFARGLSWRPPRPGPRAELLGAALVALVAALARLPGLGYSELQGDETEVILGAAGVVQNLPDALFYHGKGPGEVVAVAVEYGLVGALTEGAARLPFALAGVAGTLAFYQVARQLLGAPGALAAGLLMAVNGYLVAFSRIAQYQSLVLLLGTLALWCAVRWSRGGSDRWPLLAGALAATAALAHYDALFVLPPIGLAILWRTGWRGLRDRALVTPWLHGAAAGLAILALFFVPYLDSPLFELATARYADRVGSGFPRNNLPTIVASATLYLGTAFPVLVALLIAAGAAVFICRPDPARRRAWLLGLVWAAAPFLFYAFVARKPGTHVHVATSGLLLLAGAGFDSLWRPLGPAGPRAGRIVVGALLAAGLGLVGLYLVPVYLWSTAELVRENRLAGLPLAWRPPGGLPAKERFGFPYQAGWKAVGTLFADGALTGSYDSNEQPQVSYWYTRGAWRCSAMPRYYVIAENVQDEIDTPRRTIASEYHQIGTVTVAGAPKLRVYERGAAAVAPPATWAVEDLAPRYDRRVSVPTLDPGPWARGVMPRDAVTLMVPFGGDVDLLGYQLFAEDPRPGGVVRVDLFWQPHVASDEQHRIDVQLGREPRAGVGSGPACDKTGDDRDWTPGRPFAQRVSIPIAADAPPGTYPLLVSVSRLDRDGGPLRPEAVQGASDDPLVEIGQVEVGNGSRPGR
jgi:hypothetical protein